MKNLCKAFTIVCAFLLIGCGTNIDGKDFVVPTGLDPYINRIEPNSLSAGDTAEVYGFGFSDVAEFNILIINGTEIFADSYDLVNPATSSEIEKLTFQIPSTISNGTYDIYLDVLDNVSNTNVTVTITP